VRSQVLIGNLAVIGLPFTELPFIFPGNCPYMRHRVILEAPWDIFLALRAAIFGSQLVYKKVIRHQSYPLSIDDPRPGSRASSPTPERMTSPQTAGSNWRSESREPLAIKSSFSVCLVSLSRRKTLPFVCFFIEIRLIVASEDFDKWMHAPGGACSVQTNDKSRSAADRGADRPPRARNADGLFQRAARLRWTSTVRSRARFRDVASRAGPQDMALLTSAFSTSRTCRLL
jgi:hypothetical protein